MQPAWLLSDRNIPHFLINALTTSESRVAQFVFPRSARLKAGCAGEFGRKELGKTKQSQSHKEEAERAYHPANPVSPSMTTSGYCLS